MVRILQFLPCSRSLAVGLLLSCSAAGAQTMYVSDELFITIRTGPSTDNAVIGNLRTGDAVEVLEQNEEIGYSRVRVSDSGEEGWVLTRYLMSEISAEQRLAVLQQDHEAAKLQIADLEERLSAQEALLADTKAALEDSQTANTGISEELADIRHASANAISLRDQNESLRRTNNELSLEIEALMMQNAALASRSRQNWFVVGAIVLSAGILVGLIAPTLRSRRKARW